MVPLPRPGGWIVTVSPRHAPPYTRTIWAAQPGGLTLLAAGDSEMQILDSLLAQDLAPYGVHVSSDARQSTGLENERSFDWQREAALDASRVRPAVTVIFMGANDGFALDTPNGQVPCCGPAWSQLYAEPVARLTETMLQGDLGRVYWILLPAAGPATFKQVFNGVNLGITEAAAQFPGRVGLIDANAVLTPGNVYRNTITIDGRAYTIHEPDGVHLSVDGDQIVAQLVLARLRADRIIH
jgi:hypothetical protein